MNFEKEITYNARGHLTSPFMKALINIDKDVKRIGNEYFIDSKFGLILYGENKKGVIGTHISKIKSDSYLKILNETFEDFILKINTEALAMLIKNYKKNMISLMTYNGTSKLLVKLDDGNGFELGELIHYDERKEKIPSMSTVQQYIDSISNTQKFISLSESDVDLIVESIYRTTVDDIHVRITKQLVPGVSSKFPVSIFVDTDNIEQVGCEEVCPLIILLEKDYVDNFHIYRILKY